MSRLFNMTQVEKDMFNFGKRLKLQEKLNKILKHDHPEIYLEVKESLDRVFDMAHNYITSGHKVREMIKVLSHHPIELDDPKWGPLND